MKFHYFSALSLLGFHLAPVLASSQQDDYDNRIYFAVELNPKYSSISDLTDYLSLASGSDFPSSWTYESPITAVPNHYLFSIAKSHPQYDMLFDIGDHEPPPRKTKRSTENLLFRRQLIESGVESLEVLPPPRQLYKRGVVPANKGASTPPSVQKVIDEFDIQDPIFPDQWHLVNPIQPEHHINVTGAWAQNITGEGVSVCVIDDGLDMDSDDLKDNFFADGSWDFNDPGPYPRPRLSDDRHGTRCAGEIAAGKNHACGVGVAYNAKVAGVRILSKRISAVDEAKAINFAMDKNDIYSCSWGPSDNGQTMEAPPEIVKKAIRNAIQNGRDKKGNIYVFASGNGGSLDDNCNFDGYTNSIYSITVAAIDRMGIHPFYSESCSANMVVTYSSGSGDYIHTTDVGGKCATTHGGTSAAAPIAAGIFSLALQANPALTWRDLQYLAWDTAVPFGTDSNWQDTPAGKRFHHEYGYGKLDAYAIVEHAKTWENVKPQAWYHLPTKVENKEVPEDTTKLVEFTVTITEEDLKKANLARLEHVQVRVNADSTRRGSLTLTLTSPSGVTSYIMPKRKLDPSKAGVSNWFFMSVAHWGETGIGEWKITAQHAPRARGTAKSKLVDWQLMLWGEAIDAKRAVPFSGKVESSGSLGVNPEVSSLPVSEEPSTSTSDSNTSSSSVESSSSESLPSESSSSTSSVEPSTSSEAASSSSEEPTSTVESDSSEQPSETSETSDPDESGEPKETENKHSGFLGSLIPTFGMSKNTAAWVYGSSLLIILFVGGITGYLLWLRHRRNKNSQDYKDFNPLVPGRNADTELGEELDFLDEFSLGSHSEDEDDSDEDSPYSAGAALLTKKNEGYKDNVGGSNSGETGSSPTEISAGKRAMDLYSSAELNQSTEDALSNTTKKKQAAETVSNDTTFQLGSEDEADTPSSSDGSRTNSGSSNNTNISR